MSRSGARSETGAATSMEMGKAYRTANDNEEMNAAQIGVLPDPKARYGYNETGGGTLAIGEDTVLARSIMESKYGNPARIDAGGTIRLPAAAGILSVTFTIYRDSAVFLSETVDYAMSGGTVPFGLFGLDESSSQGDRKLYSLVGKWDGRVGAPTVTSARLLVLEV